MSAAYVYTQTSEKTKDRKNYFDYINDIRIFDGIWNFAPNAAYINTQASEKVKNRQFFDYINDIGILDEIWFSHRTPRIEIRK